MAIVPIPHPLNPFLPGGALGQAPVISPLMNPVPMAQQRLMGAPMMQRPQQMPMPAMPAQNPAATPAPAAAPGGLAALAGGNGVAGLGGDAGLAFAAGLLGGGSDGEALGRAFGNVLAQRSASAGATDDLKEYAAAKSQGYTGSFIDFMKDVKATSARAYGLTPIYARDPATGKIIAMQPSNNGGPPRQMEAPDGYQIMSPGEVAGSKMNATVDAKTQANARAMLPGAEVAVGITREAIDKLRNDAAGQADQFGRFLGVIPQQMTPALPGTPKAKFRVNLEQATGGAFMQARQMLKGGGAITDYEGRRGEAAYSRMQAAADSGDQQQFLEALDDFEQAVEQGFQKLQATAQGGYSQDAIMDRGTAPPDGGWQIEEVP